MVENQWRELYMAAVVEVDRNKLRQRVQAAEDALRARASLDGPIARDERIAMEDAMSALRVLKREWQQNSSR
jgi:hypothetical protein